MPLTFYASTASYLNHLAPVWAALPAKQRGPFLCPPRFQRRAVDLGVPYPVWGQPARGHVVTAGWQDSRLFHYQPVALVEHGAGQTYSDVPREMARSYAGGPGRDNIGLFLCPGERVAQRNRAAYPDARVEVVGPACLDRWTRARQANSEGAPPTIAVAFHWDGARVCQEARWALPHYWPLSDLTDWAARHGIRILGHGHPRAEGKLRRLWMTLGVPWATYEQVMTEADVLIVDNSSLGFEAAAVGIPVVWLNAPWYRRDVSHGLRFWNYVPGEIVNEPGDLPHATQRALDARRSVWDCRPDPYAYVDGQCAQRAATALLDWVG